MRRSDLLGLFAIMALPAAAQAQGTVTLTCKDAAEEIGKPAPDALVIAMLSNAVRTAFKNQDADQAGNGGSSITAGWSQDAMTGQVMAVLLSCRGHSADTLEKRTADLFKAYLIRHAA